MKIKMKKTQRKQVPLKEGGVLTRLAGCEYEVGNDEGKVMCETGLAEVVGVAKAAKKAAKKAAAPVAKPAVDAPVDEEKSEGGSESLLRKVLGRRKKKDEESSDSDD